MMGRRQVVLERDINRLKQHKELLIFSKICNTKTFLKT